MGLLTAGGNEATALETPTTCMAAPKIKWNYTENTPVIHL